MASTPPISAPYDNSSLGRKVSIPAAAFAITVLVGIGLQVGHVSLTTEQYAIGGPALTTLLTFLGDYFLPNRFLA